MALLELDGLRVAFSTGTRKAEVLRGVSMTIESGEAVGLLGESGSGKSMTALAALRLIPPPGQITGGAVRFAGHDLLALSEQQMRIIRGRELSLVFQDPLTALNPAFRVGQQLLHVIRTHTGLSSSRARIRAMEILELVGLPDPARVMRSFPHQLSGGMRQRALVGMAVSCQPKLLIADEPTTALDVTVQAQIIELFRRLRRELNLTLLFITHNLDLMAELVDRAIVMYAGTVVEAGTIEELFARPRHPYTSMLIRCVPRLDRKNDELAVISGMPPAFGAVVTGCPFEPRCPLAVNRCRYEQPVETIDRGHHVACWVAGHE